MGDFAVLLFQRSPDATGDRWGTSNGLPESGRGSSAITWSRAGQAAPGTIAFAFRSQRGENGFGILAASNLVAMKARFGGEMPNRCSEAEACWSSMTIGHPALPVWNGSGDVTARGAAHSSRLPRVARRLS